MDYLGANPEYWGKSIADGGGADPAFSMTSTSPSATSTWLVTVTGYAGNETFGIYDKGNSNALMPIFGP